MPKTPTVAVDVLLIDALKRKCTSSELSPVLRAVVLCGHFVFGRSVPEVCASFDISRQAFYSIKRSFVELKSFEDRPRTGRPRLLTDDVQEDILTIAKLAPTITSKQLATVANLPSLSPSTI